MCQNKSTLFLSGEIMKNKLFVIISICTLISCSSTQVIGNSTITNKFESSHGCFSIHHTHLKNEFKIYACLGTAFKDFMTDIKMNNPTLFKYDDKVFFDVFNEYKSSNNILKNCYSKDILKLVDSSATSNTTMFYVDVVYECESS